MPPRRRAAAAKAKTKLKTLSTQLKESSSAEDTDSNAATQCREIVKRLAKKYLLKSSTDTTDSSDHKENLNGKAQVTDPYDADLETDGGVTTTSDMECQTDESSLMEDSVILSPSRKANKQNTGRVTRRRRGQQQQTTASQKTKQKKTPITYQKQKNTSRRKSEQANRGCQTDSEEYEPQSVKKTRVQSLQESDSGMFMSPIGNRPIPKLPRMNASDTSTPSSAIGKSLDDSCFGFDNITSPQGLPFSPVESLSPEDGGVRPGSAMLSPEDGGVRPGSAMSSLHGSMSSETKSILSPPKRKYDSLNLTGLIPGDSDQADMPVKKKSKKKKVTVKKNDDEWASKLSAEFDDIDMYELIIE